ncbi:EAL domain-containing protein [Dechloromonas sp. XY25]|uniref:EAL domain-containing protein n=1 Tax=Dechloromonas hankyongensis TaxID=2908002 RepID=A0ABS9K1Y1_9RHOO|nr:EAL domain-containing protein [Dechloromonas hankyongensis]MCG2577150.1 EAL domain-containing protein [Dechloromonas hankyongensis]
MKRTKIWVRLVISILIAVLASGAGLIHWATLEQKNLAIEQSKDFAMSVHQMTLAGLTGMMITGTVGLRTIFLDQIKETNHIEALKVMRGDGVIKQYGLGFDGESASDALETRVLVTGDAYFNVIRNKDGEERLKAIIPVKAAENYLGKNCLFCHEVPAGTVLGAVSMEVSLSRADETARSFGRRALLVGALVCIPLAAFIWLFISRLVTRPLKEMTDGLNRVADEDIEQARPLPVLRADEVGDATTAFNRVMDKSGELFRQQRMARIVFENSLEGITVTDAQSRIQLVNKAFADTTGYSADEVIGKTPGILKSGKQGDDFYAAFWAALQRDGEWRGEIWNKRKNGSVYAEWLNVSAVRNRAGEVEHYVAIFSDITERKEREEAITFQAFHDALTGLPNRLLYKDRLDQALSQAKRTKGRKPVVMFLDLDKFKQINDQLGHDVGDLLLKEVAARLKGCVRSADTVARFAGDEFTVLLPEASGVGDAQVVADKILAAMQEPIKLGSEERVVTTSIGISLFPDDGRDGETLMKAADAAMYQVKRAGRAGCCFFTADMIDSPTRRADLEARLKDAFINREFVLHYQPIIDLQTGIVHGKEALLRWQDSSGQLLMPDDFIGPAEEVGLMTKLGEWVLEKACIQARMWQLEEHPVRVAVNLSASEFKRPDLVAVVRDTLRRAGLSPALLELEVAESIVMQDADYSRRTFRGLADLGVMLSLGNFGTGYLSLGLLRHLPIHTVKVDRSLIREHLNESGDKRVLDAIFGLANALGLKAVAEGLESIDQLVLLHSYPCDRAQGFAIARPEPDSEPGQSA